MKDYSSSSKLIDANNVFSVNRLGLSDAFEEGKSLTLGLDYKLDYTLDYENEKKKKDKFLEFKLASVFRDKFEDKIPTNSTINQKSSNIFGSINNQLSENIKFRYDFSLDNDLKTFDSHAIDTEISINNFVTELILLKIEIN